MKKFHHIQILDKMEHLDLINTIVKQWKRTCGIKHVNTIYTAMYTHYNRKGFKRIKEMAN